MATTAADSASPAASEWLSIVETQQRELQELRAQVTSRTPSPGRWNDDAIDDARSAFAASPARSFTSSSSSSSSRRSSSHVSEDQVLPLDLQRYAKVCGDLEATRQRLTVKDAKHRELRARASQMKLEIDKYRQQLHESTAHVSMLTVQLESEQMAKREAVERAAVAMVQSEEMSLKLGDAMREVETLRAEMLEYTNATHSLERRHSKTQDANREAIARLEATLQLAQQDNDSLTAHLQAERDAQARHVCRSQHEETLRARVDELERILMLQTAQLEKQQLVIVELHSALSAMEQQLATDRTQHQRHITQQIAANMSLQQIVDDTAAEIRALRVALAESNERNAMQDEELAAYAAWRRSAMRRESQRELAFGDAYENKDKMERAVRSAEASRRKAIMELAETKRQLAQLRTALVGVDSELQRMNKTFGVFRTREANVSRTLREYSRRNRVLLDAVRAMSSKVLHLSESLQRSEKRKQQVVVESHELKRGLVIERCQREDLLQQCAELETCLTAFQRAAFASAERAQSVDKENAVLQHAVAQLCAYSREITQSQQALQYELKQLELRGRVEPQVFG